MTACNILIGGVKVEQVKEFIYLGSMFTRDGKYDIDIERRVNAGNQNVTLRPIQMLNQWHYQSLMTPRIKQVRCMSEVEEEWPKLEINVNRNIGKDYPTCEECENRRREQQSIVKEDQKASEAESTGLGISEKSESETADFLDTWRDPLTIKIQLANPPEEMDETTDSGHNISML